MKRLRRLEIAITSVAFVLTVSAYLVHPGTVEFFAAVVAGMALIFVVIRALVGGDWRPLEE